MNKCSHYPCTSFNKHQVILQSNFDTHLSELLLQRKTAIAFFMGQAAHTFYDRSAFARSCKGDQWRKKVGAVRGVEMECLQLTGTDGNLFFFDRNNRFSLYQRLQDRLISLG